MNNISEIKLKRKLISLIKKSDYGRALTIIEYLYDKNNNIIDKNFIKRVVKSEIRKDKEKYLNTSFKPPTIELANIIKRSSPSVGVPSEIEIDMEYFKK